jgi:[pyruvate, water dikinase]-phosphate phosphotransferase / [pyruvate, water dikinase] kinase
MQRIVFMISDGTGITVESLGKSLLSQFEKVSFEKHTLPYIDTVEKAQQVVLRINRVHQETGQKPLVFLTLVNPQITEIMHQASACVFDFFNTFMHMLEHELGEKSSDKIGRAHGVADRKTYDQRMDAVNYALNYDDGMKTSGYERADLILIGVSRCGKTPSCLYMALRFGIFAANYPFTDEDFTNLYLPKSLKPYKHKLVGLTIDPSRLEHIRTERSPNTRYASAEQCRREIIELEKLYVHENIPFINSTRYSVEEIATKIMAMTKVKRRI